MTDLRRDVLEYRRRRRLVLEFYGRLVAKHAADLERDRRVNRILRRWPATGPRGLTALVNWVIFRRWPGER